MYVRRPPTELYEVSDLFLNCRRWNVEGRELCRRSEKRAYERQNKRTAFRIQKENYGTRDVSGVGKRTIFDYSANNFRELPVRLINVSAPLGTSDV